MTRRRSAAAAHGGVGQVDLEGDLVKGGGGSGGRGGSGRGDGGECGGSCRGIGGDAGSGGSDSENITGGDVLPSVWFNDEDPSTIPEALRREEEDRRRAAKRALERYKKSKSQYQDHARGGAGGGGAPIRPKVPEPRIWWARKDGTGLWKRRIPNAAIMIDDWGTFNLSQEEQAKASCRSRTSTIHGPTDRGHKMLEAETVFVTRTHRTGYGIHANREMDIGEIVGPYSGFPYSSEQLGRHSTGRKECTHRLAIRRRLATMPPNWSGIEGPVLKPGTKHDGREYPLKYYRKNGYGSLLNSDRHSKCNCKIISEYKNYETRRGGDPSLYVDDEYCPADVPRNRRVPPRPSFPLFPRPTQPD